MGREKSGRIREAAIVIITVMLCLYAALLAGDIIYAAQQGDIEVENSEDLTITIVEDDQMVQDAGVPLAAGPSDNDFIVHAVLGGALLAVCVIYAVYFSRYQKRLFMLRRELAEAEAEAMKR